MTSDVDSWMRLGCILHVLRQRPAGLGGLILRMRAGPDRDAALAEIAGLPGRHVRIHGGMGDDALYGGVNMARTLASGTIIRSDGVLAGCDVCVLSMAERCSTDFVARLLNHARDHPNFLIIALDEGAEPAERCPDILAERLAFLAEPLGRPPANWYAAPPVTGAEMPVEDAASLLTQTAATFGIDSLRAPSYALNTAKALAAHRRKTALTQGDCSIGAALAFAHRATQVPEDNAPENAGSPEPAEGAEPHESDAETAACPEELVLAAVKAILPPEVLAGLQGFSSSARGVSGRGQGHRRKGNRRGRPLPSRKGRLDGRARLDVIATLRAAAPWQRIRRAAHPERSGVLLHKDDIHTKRFETRSDRLLVFAVDASGSAAVARLNEAKGAIELLLGRAYAARDHIGLVSFRGDKAECLLAPTRSLVRAKKHLAQLPGGGGTPLALGLAHALEQAQSGRAKGMSPIILLLTDGRANVALDGSANRTAATEDATRMARACLMAGIPSLVIDTSIRPQTALRDLAQHMDGRYIPLPRADAARMSTAIGASLDET